MEFLQEMAMPQGGQFNPAYLHALHGMQEHSDNADAAAGSNNVLSRFHHKNNDAGLPASSDYLLTEGMDETTLLLPAVSDTHLLNIDSLNTSSIGLSTNNSTTPQFCEVSNTRSAYSTAYIPCTIKRRSWQEALTLPLIQPRMLNISASTQIHSNMHPAECIGVDNILNLHHIQALGATNGKSTDPNYLMPKTLITNSATHIMPLEESLLAAYEKGGPAHTPNIRSFLSALSEGDEAFFKQQLLVPMEGICTDDPMPQAVTPLWNDHEEPGSSIAELWIHCPSASVVTDRSSAPLKKMSDKSIGSSCGAHVNMSKDNDEQIRASHEVNGNGAVRGADMPRVCSSISIGANRSEAQYFDVGGNVEGVSISSHKAAALAHIKAMEAADSKKRFLAEYDSASYMTQSKRAHLGPHGKHISNYCSNMMRHSSSSSSLNNMSESTIVMNDTPKSNDIASYSAQYPSKAKPKSSGRNRFGPALNTNLKPRARQGTANDPQTVAARNRRERINARLKVLQELVPNGSKVDLVTMLEKAINYVKFLQLQLRVLSNDEFWQANQLEKATMQSVLSMEVEDDAFDNSDHLVICDHTSVSCTTNNIL